MSSPHRINHRWYLRSLLPNIELPVSHTLQCPATPHRRDRRLVVVQSHVDPLEESYWDLRRLWQGFSAEARSSALYRYCFVAGRVADLVRECSPIGRL